MTLRPRPAEEWTERELTAAIAIAEADLADLYRRRAGRLLDDGAAWCARCGRVRLNLRDNDTCDECELDDLLPGSSCARCGRTRVNAGNGIESA